MRFIILVMATKDTEEGVMPSEDLLNAQLQYHTELVKAGLLVDGTGLKPTTQAWRVTYPDGKPHLVQGPFAEGKLIAGYTVIQVASREEAMDWAMRYPPPAANEADAMIEIREFFEVEDFGPSPAIEGFIELGMMDKIADDVGRARPDLAPMTAPNGTVTILFTDIEGSTQLTEALGDREWMSLLREHNEIVRTQMTAHSGFEVKSQGDGFMLAFTSARDALRSAMGIQRTLAERDTDRPELRVRIGVHTGEPIREAEDFYGKAVVLAARIAAEARGSEILVSGLVRELTESSGEFSFEAPTDTELKGLSGMYKVSALRWTE